MLEVQHSVSLAELTTMGVGGSARFYCEVSTKEAIREAVLFARKQNIPFWILGEGSNTIAHDGEYSGLIIKPTLCGITIDKEDLKTATITVGGGENWSTFVDYAVEHSLQGIEAMTLIPGTVGAAPVQNIGAYGQEVADVICSLDAYDTHNDTFTTLSAKECGFSYRHSIFRGEEMGRYILHSVTFQLQKSTPTGPFYAAIEQYCKTYNRSIQSVKDVRDIVAAIRTEKLPNPSVVANSGSFFKNSIISQQKWQEIVTDYPSAPHYTMPDNTVKVPSGWLIESCGLKGFEQYGMAVHDKNALVLKNLSTTHYSDLVKMRAHIISTVEKNFGITLEQEPLEIR